MKNQLAKIVEKLNKKPQWLRYRLLSYVLGSTVKFVGTAGIKCLRLSHKKAVFKLANKKKVRNHVGGVHAAATALLAETATGMALAMHIPDNKLPLLKSMHCDYVKRASGDLMAQASLTEEQIEKLHLEDKGSFIITCCVTDENNEEPVISQMQWAWIIKD